jgi:hypothetical protein
MDTDRDSAHIGPGAVRPVADRREIFLFIERIRPLPPPLSYFCPIAITKG